MNHQTAPSFAEPWQAEAFALAVALQDAGVLDRKAWSEVLGAELARQGNSDSSQVKDGGNDPQRQRAYFAAWLATLELMLLEAGLLDDQELRNRVAAWRQAYLDTPHGQPVNLPD